MWEGYHLLDSGPCRWAMWVVMVSEVMWGCLSTALFWQPPYWAPPSLTHVELSGNLPVLRALPNSTSADRVPIRRLQVKSCTWWRISIFTYKLSIYHLCIMTTINDTSISFISGALLECSGITVPWFWQRWKATQLQHSPSYQVRMC